MKIKKIIQFQKILKVLLKQAEAALVEKKERQLLTTNSKERTNNLFK